MNKLGVDENIHDLCKKYTKLNQTEIDYLYEQAKIVSDSKAFQNYDIFIDVRDALSGEAIVVFHRQPVSGPSIYEDKVVGKTAYRKDEPGPLRTLETSQISTELYAKSQEGKFIKQTSFPLDFKDNTIAVLILEQDLSGDIKEKFNVSTTDHSYEVVSEVVQELETIGKSISNYVDDAILIFDKDGYLRNHNQAADNCYKEFGYLNQINGMHYDNLALDLTTFDVIQKAGRRGDFSAFGTKEIKFDKYYFKVKTIYLQTKGFVISIMKDITEEKVKESRYISDLVTIQEIHHRVKNNLQTVVSLLRLQARRAESPEAKKVLNESVNRVLSIAATHELLSKQKEDDVQLKMVLDEVIHHLSRFYADSFPVKMTSQIDPSIILDSNKAVTVALITNELVQNCYDHAFVDKTDGSAEISINITKDEGYIQFIIQDNGQGFDFNNGENHNLGLQIVTSFVESKLNGFMVVDSDDDGSKIRMVF